MKKIFLFLFMSLLLINIVSASLDTGLMHWWKFDETSGTNAIDSKGGSLGFEINFTLYNGASFDTGILGNGVSFDGINDFATTTGVLTGLAENGTGNHAVGFWAYPNEQHYGWTYCSNDSSEAAGVYRQLLYNRINEGEVRYYYDGAYSGSINAAYNASQWNFVVFNKNNNHIELYVNGILRSNLSTTYGNNQTHMRFGSDAGISLNSIFNGSVDEAFVYNRSLSPDEVTQLYNDGSALTYPFAGGVTPIFINLTLPENGSLLSSAEYSFNATYNITGDNDGNYSWINSTINIWYSNYSIFNQTTNTISGNNTVTNFVVDSFTLNNYLWNVYSCYGNDTYHNCNWSNSGNYSFTVGSELLNITYNLETYETSLENFLFTIHAIEGAEVSFAYLVYNGTNYTISDISYDGSNYLFSRSIDIPLNNYSFSNQTNQFYLSFTYAGSFVQNFQTYYQNSSFINLQICNSTYNTQTLNFTLTDELSYNKINATDNPTTFQSTFNYWTGDGSVVKNYSYQLINSSSNSNYSFCIYPWPTNYNKTIKTTMTSTYSAYEYSEREYNLYNSSLTNASSDIILYLLDSSNYQKFTITVKEGITNLQDAIVTVSKYFLGDGTYKTVSIRKTDNAGQFVEYLELDRDYEYYINVDGVLRAIIDKRASCSAAPCEMTLQIDGEQGNPLEGYYDYFSNGTLSNMTFDPDTKIVTYNFYDLTGLAHYFRLVVEQINLNETQGTICDSYSFSSSGTLTCNVTGYSGDFIAKGYISRSPEKIDKVISFVIGDLIGILGKLSLFVCFLIILTVTIAGGVISQGNPSGVLAGFGLSVLVCKLMTIFPFSWVVVSIVELVIVALLIEVKSR